MHRAGELRRTPTPAEARLWAHLRGAKLRGVGFRRQHAIGRYVVDFCAPRHKLIIELDGSQHVRQAASDARRTQDLESQGYRVIRFWNDQVLKDIQAVGAVILDALNLTQAEESLPPKAR